MCQRSTGHTNGHDDNTRAMASDDDDERALTKSTTLVVAINERGDLKKARSESRAASRVVAVRRLEIFDTAGRPVDRSPQKGVVAIADTKSSFRPALLIALVVATRR